VWTRDDRAAGERIWGDAEVMRFVGPPLAPDAVARSIDAGIAHHARHGVQHWAVIVRATGELIGCCGFHVAGDDLELVYHFARAHWGRGYATEAARACVAHARDTLGAARIVASIVPGNDASRRVLEKLGFTRAGATDDGEERYSLLRSFRPGVR
jgi:RimJ/RimL family protein N-acetyltransferase